MSKEQDETERRAMASVRVCKDVPLLILEDPGTRVVAFCGHFSLEEAIEALKTNWAFTEGV